jgi:replicative DNA helicase|tara:strand:+ start:1472 stop:2782 length:1311 start_codon:yes stop_codon:yes gene_type:complete
MGEGLVDIPELPHSLVAEKAVLSAILIDPKDAFEKAVDIMSPDDFYTTSHKLIFKAMVTVAEDGGTPGLVKVDEYLKRTGNLEEIGGTYYLTEFLYMEPTAGRIREHAKIIRDKAVERAVVRDIHNFNKNPSNLNSSDNLDRLVAKLRNSSDAMQSPHRGEKTIMSLSDLGEQYIKEWENEMNGIHLGIPPIDERIRCVSPGQVLTVLGFTGVGKTAFLLNVAREVVTNQEKRCLFFSLEMPGTEIFERYCQMSMGIWGDEVHKRASTDENFLDKIERLPGADNLCMIDLPAVSWPEVENNFNRASKNFPRGIDAIFVDYLGLMSNGNGSAIENANKLAIGMKETARKLNVPIVVASQVTGVESIHEEISLMRVRDSKTIAHSSDYVLTLRRRCEAPGQSSGTMVVSLIKNRRGGNVETELTFDFESTLITWPHRD